MSWRKRCVSAQRHPTPPRPVAQARPASRRRIPAGFGAAPPPPNPPSLPPKRPSAPTLLGPPPPTPTPRLAGRGDDPGRSAHASVVPAQLVAVASCLIAGTSCPTLARNLVAHLGSEQAAVEVRRFPDEEVYTRITSDVNDKTVIVLQSTFPNDNFVELLLLQDAAKEAGAAKVISVIPYYGYARQDQVFQPGEAVSSRALARAIMTSADVVVTVDPHKAHVLDFFAGRAHGVTAVPALATTLGEWGVDAILAPDKGAVSRARDAAGELGIPYDYLEKTRLSATDVRMATKDLDVAGKRVAILDDMIASGATMVAAAKQLKNHGAQAVYAACTHGLFTGGAVPKLLAGGIDRVLAADTLETSGCDQASAAAAIATKIHALL